MARGDSQQLQRQYLEDMCGCTGRVLADSAGGHLFPQHARDGLDGPGHAGHHLLAVSLRDTETQLVTFL